MRNISMLALVAVFAPGLALAQQGSVSLGYGQLDPSVGFNQEVFSISGTVEQENPFISGLTLSLTGRYSDLDNLGYTAVAFGDARYEVRNGIYVGVYGQKTDLPGVTNLDSIGLVIGYDAGPIETNLFYGQTDGNDIDDTDDYGIAMSYSRDDFAVYGSYQNSNAGGGADFEAIGVTGSYTFLREVSVFATYATFSGDLGEDLGDDFDAYGIGAAYAFNGLITGAPLVVSAEYTKTDLDDGFDIDELGVAVTIMFGNNDNVVPEQSLAGSIANPGYSSFSTFFDAAF